MADQFYGAGIAAQQGLINGLIKDSRALDRAARRLARKLAVAVRRALGIHSPSTVFKAIGDQVTQGLVIGLDETYVKRSAASLASSLQKGFGTPALEAYASQTAGSGSPTIHVRLSADQVTQVQRGREIAIDLDAYILAGGRRRAV